MPLADTQAKRRGDRTRPIVAPNARRATLTARFVRSLGGLLTLASLGCASAAEGPIVAPLGNYETEVGAPWSLQLVTLDPGAGGLRWTLDDAPQDMHLSASAELTWVATAFDLALGQPGRPRAAGPAQTIRLHACDRALCCVAIKGTIRTVPSPR